MADSFGDVLSYAKIPMQIQTDSINQGVQLAQQQQQNEQKKAQLAEQQEQLQQKKFDSLMGLTRTAMTTSDAMAKRLIPALNDRARSLQLPIADGYFESIRQDPELKMNMHYFMDAMSRGEVSGEQARQGAFMAASDLGMLKELSGTFGEKYKAEAAAKLNANNNTTKIIVGENHDNTAKRNADVRASTAKAIGSLRQSNAEDRVIMAAGDKISKDPNIMKLVNQRQQMSLDMHTIATAETFDPQTYEEVQQGIATAISNGKAAAVSTIERNSMHTLEADLVKYKQYWTGHKEDIDNPRLKSDLLNILTRLNDSYGQNIKSRAESLGVGMEEMHSERAKSAVNKKIANIVETGGSPPIESKVAAPAAGGAAAAGGGVAGAVAGLRSAGAGDDVIRAKLMSRKVPPAEIDAALKGK